MATGNSLRARQLVRNDFWAGARAAFPLCVGIAPYGVLVGLLGLATDLGALGTLGTSLFVFAGSAQFLALSLLHSSTAYILVVLTTGIVNLRHLLYSASLAPRLRSLPGRWKALLSFFLTDECYAVLSQDVARTDGESSRYFWFGAGLALYCTWVLSTICGLTLGGRIGDTTAWGLDFTLAATFIGLLVPRLRGRSAWGTAMVAGAVALAGYRLPGGLGILLAIVLAATVGWGMETWRSRS